MYRSESPSQIFVFLINFLRHKLKDVPADQWNQVFVAYDNMCNVDRMKAAKEDLPFEAPFNKQWISISKIIDVFHLKKKGQSVIVNIIQRHLRRFIQHSIHKLVNKHFLGWEDSIGF